MDCLIYAVARFLRRLSRFTEVLAIKAERYILKRRFPEDWAKVESLLSSMSTFMKEGPKITIKEIQNDTTTTEK